MVGESRIRRFSPTAQIGHRLLVRYPWPTRPPGPGARIELIDVEIDVPTADNGQQDCRHEHHTRQRDQAHS